MVRVTISRRDTADTAITAELLDSSLHVHSFSLSPGSGRGEEAVILNRIIDKACPYILKKGYK